MILQNIHSIAKKVLCTIALGVMVLSGCKNTETAEQEAGVTTKNAAHVSAQPLPGGKEYFSVVSGNMDNLNDTWVQLVNMRFFASTGTVAGSRWWWGSTNKKDAVSLGLNHNCTMDGELGSCKARGPNGWLSGTTIKQSVAGNYTFNTTTNELVITWTDAALSPRVEKWVMSAPFSTLARMDLTESVTGWGGNGQTHGVGFGSLSDWSIHKSIANIAPLNYSNGGKVMTTRTGAGVRATTGWTGDGFNMTGWTTSANGQLWHAKVGPDVCTAGCSAGNEHPGHIYHLAGEGTNGTSRSMAYTHYCACLPPLTKFPCYDTGNIHPYAFMQLIDDGGTLKGFIGVEAQNPPDAVYNGQYQFQLKWYLKP